MSTSFAKLTGAEFDRMVDRGAFDCIEGKKVELLRGELRFKNPAGPIHDDYIDYLTRCSVGSTFEKKRTSEFNVVLSAMTIVPSRISCGFNLGGMVGLAPPPKM